MADLIRFDLAADEPSLFFECGELPVDDVVAAADMEPNGYFWEGVLRFLDPSLAEDLELDSEAGMFCAYGTASTLDQARVLIEPYLTDSAEVSRLIERAEASGFDLEDSEVDEPATKTSFLRRILGRR